MSENQQQAEAYLDRVVANLAREGEGGRNNAGFRAGAALGERRHLLDVEAWRPRLVDALRSAGLAEAEAEAVIANGIRQGESSPAALGGSPSGAHERRREGPRGREGSRSPPPAIPQVLASDAPSAGWVLRAMRWNNVSTTTGAAFTPPWSALAAAVVSGEVLPEGSDLEARKKKLSVWSPGEWPEQSRESGAPVGRLSALVLDLDADPARPAPACGEPRLDLAALSAGLAAVIPGCAWLAHTTVKSTPGSWRWRVIVPLAESVPEGSYTALVDLLRVRALTGRSPFMFEADATSSRSPRRCWFVPAYPLEGKADYIGHAREGALLDGVGTLDAARRGDTLKALATRLELDCEAFRAVAVTAWEAKTEAEAGLAALPWVVPTGDWLTAPPSPRRYLLHDEGGLGEPRGAGMLARGIVGVLAAGGGTGKTFALCALALSVVSGRPWLGRFPVGPGGTRRAVLILGEEEAGEVQRRLYAQAEAMGGVAPECLSGLLILPGSGLATLALTQAEERNVPAATPFSAALLAHLEAHAGDGWDAIILDPLSRFAGPDVETDNAAATRLIQVLESFTKLPGRPAVVLAHHNRKKGKDDSKEMDASLIRGSSALVDGARWAAMMEADHADAGDGPSFARLTVVKSNYAPPPKGDRAVLLVRASGGGLRAATVVEREARVQAIARAKEAEARAAKKSDKPPKPTNGGAYYSRGGDPE